MDLDGVRSIGSVLSVVQTKPHRPAIESHFQRLIRTRLSLGGGSDLVTVAFAKSGLLLLTALVSHWVYASTSEFGK